MSLSFHFCLSLFQSDHLGTVTYLTAVLTWLFRIWILGMSHFSTCVDCLPACVVFFLTYVDLFPACEGCFPVCAGTLLGPNSFDWVNKKKNLITQIEGGCLLKTAHMTQPLLDACIQRGSTHLTWPDPIKLVEVWPTPDPFRVLRLYLDSGVSK